jgi:hypothetical protein
MTSVSENVTNPLTASTAMSTYNKGHSPNAIALKPLTFLHSTQQLSKLVKLAPFVFD